MISIFSGILLFVAPLTPTSAQDKGPDKSPAPREQYQALLKAFQTASSAGGVLTDAERMKFVGQVYKHRYGLAQKFLELAEKHPTDPVALDALIQATWLVNNMLWPAELVGKDRASAKALAQLERDHIGSDKLGSVCERIAGGFAKEYEPFLRSVLAKSPHRSVQAQACLGLAHYLSSRVQRIDLVKEDRELAKDFADLFGKEYLEQLLKQNAVTAGKEAEALLENALEKYGDVKIYTGTVAQKAKAELFEIRHLIVGKTAPDIEGVDQDGKKFKLSDYRGKVVLLDFWHQQ